MEEAGGRQGITTHHAAWWPSSRARSRAPRLPRSRWHTPAVAGQWIIAWIPSDA